MTVEEMVVEVWEMLGKPSDLTPYSNPPTNSTFEITSDGAVRILGWINRGYRAVLNWKLPDGTHIDFPSKRAVAFFTIDVPTGTATTASSYTITLDEAALATSDDYFNGWIIKITSGTGSGQVRLITDFDTVTQLATVSKTWDTTPDNTSVYEIYQPFVEILATGHARAAEAIVIDPVNTFIAPEMLHDVTNMRSLPKGSNTWSNIQNRLAYGQPSQYFWDQSRLWFDRAVDEQITYEIEYIRQPTDLTLSTDEPEIPEPWHTPIVYWALHEGLRRAQESGEAWAVKKDFNDFVASLIQPREQAWDKEESTLEVY
jgi:hypothetical protein